MNLFHSEFLQLSRQSTKNKAMKRENVQTNIALHLQGTPDSNRGYQGKNTAFPSVFWYCHGTPGHSHCVQPTFPSPNFWLHSYISTSLNRATDLIHNFCRLALTMRLNFSPCSDCGPRPGQMPRLVRCLSVCTNALKSLHCGPPASGLPRHGDPWSRLAWDCPGFSTERPI